jgi:hypothetical protein
MAETGGIITGIGSLILGGIGLGQSSSANSKNAKLAQEQMRLQKIKDIAQLEGQLADYDISITEARAQADSYDKWLGNYQNQYDQQVASKNAQTEALKASGQEAYENFMNAIGYSDALAGATGRIGGGTSAGAATKAVDTQLVSYVGEDRTLDSYGGLFGAQLGAANLETAQMIEDLKLQKYEAEQNRDIAFQSIAHYENAKARTRDTINKLR